MKPVHLTLAAAAAMLSLACSAADDKPATAARGPTMAAAQALATSGPAPSEAEAAIRKALTERIPGMPKIDEISRTPIAGLYEVRYAGNQLLYSDATGEHIVIQGSIIETRTRADLTERRMEKLLAIDFGKLPLKDAITIKQGSGARKVAVFVDPNCGYCKRFERDLAAAKDVTVYTFLMPILGPDSVTKTHDIWCAKDSAKAWREWMLQGVTPPSSRGTKCDVAAVDRVLEFGRKHRINGTPAIVFEDGTRKPGAIPAEMLEQLLAGAGRKS